MRAYIYLCKNFSLDDSGGNYLGVDDKYIVSRIRRLFFIYYAHLLLFFLTRVK